MADSHERRSDPTAVIAQSRSVSPVKETESLSESEANYSVSSTSQTPALGDQHSPAEAVSQHLKTMPSALTDSRDGDGKSPAAEDAVEPESHGNSSDRLNFSTESRSVSPVNKTDSLIEPDANHPSISSPLPAQALSIQHEDAPAISQQLEPSASTSPSRSDEVKGKPEDSTAWHDLRLWSPTELHINTLLSFVALYGLLIVALLIMLIVDRQHQGLATSRLSLHYLWTYGPTLVLSIVATFWDHVDYRTRQLMPWTILHSGDGADAKTLLLDYTSMADWLVVWRSAKARHFPVLISTASTWLIKLLIVVSTGLLILQVERQTHRDVAVQALDKFDPVAWRLDSNRTVPAMFAFGVTDLSIAYPPGTSDRFAVPEFHLSADVPPNATIQTQAYAFEGTLECEHGNITAFDDTMTCTSRGSCSDIMPDLTIESPSCQFGKVDWPSDSNGQFIFPSSGALFAMAFTGPCNTSFDGQQTRLIIATGLLDASSDDSDEQRRASNVTVWICKPRNTIRAAQIVVDPSGALLEVHPDGANVTQYVDEYTMLDWDLTESVLSSITDSGTIFDQIWQNTTDILTDLNRDDSNTSIAGESYYWGLDSFFNLYAATVKPERSAELLDGDLVLRNAQWLYKLSSAQVAKENLISPGSVEQTGTLTTYEQRLRMHNLSTYWMFAVLAVLLLLALALAFVAPRHLVSCDPGPIINQAAILAKSERLRLRLQHAGATSLKQLQALLKDHDCAAVSDLDSSPPSFSVRLRGSESAQPLLESKGEDPSGKLRWWQPFSLSAWTKGSVILLLVGLVVALEVLYQQSEQHQGLANVESDGSGSRYGWRYVLSTVMLLTSIIIGMMASDSKALLPYHQLRHWPSTAASTLYTDERSRFAVVSLMAAIKNKHLSIVAVIAATIAAFPLTIVSSGLFTVKQFNSTTTVPYVLGSVIHLPTASQSNAFAEVLPLDTSTTSVEVTLLFNRNLTSPLWTFEDLVFPEISTSMIDQSASGAGSTDSQSASLELDLPAWRSVLECGPVELSTGDLSFYNDVRSSVQELSVAITYNSSQPVCGGYFTYSDRHVAPVPTGDPFYLTSMSHYMGKDYPYLVHVYGTMPELDEYRANKTAPDMRAMSCCARVEQLNVRATFEMPSMRIVHVQRDESTSFDIRKGASPVKARVFEALRAVVEDLWPTNTGNYSDVPGFFRAVLAQTPELTIDDLLGRENAPRLAAGLSRVWSSIYPHLANRVARYPRLDNDTNVPAATEGTITRLDRPRLVQDKVSTHILSALLAFIAVCVAVSFWSMNVREVVPKDPSSFGAVASLLAGSRLLGMIPPGAEWSDVGNRGMRDFMASTTVSMGWWETNDGRRFGIDVGRAAWD